MRERSVGFGDNSWRWGRPIRLFLSVHPSPPPYTDGKRRAPPCWPPRAWPGRGRAGCGRWSTVVFGVCASKSKVSTTPTRFDPIRSKSIATGVYISICPSPLLCTRYVDGIDRRRTHRAGDAELVEAQRRHRGGGRREGRAVGLVAFGGQRSCLRDIGPARRTWGGGQAHVRAASSDLTRGRRRPLRATRHRMPNGAACGCGRRRGWGRPCGLRPLPAAASQPYGAVPFGWPSGSRPVLRRPTPAAHSAYRECAMADAKAARRVLRAREESSMVLAWGSGACCGPWGGLKQVSCGVGCPQGEIDENGHHVVSGRS